MNAPRYLQLNAGGTFGRMFALRAIVAESTRGNRPPSHAVIDWRAARAYGFTNWADSHGALAQGVHTENAGTPFEEKSAIWYCHTGPQFRNETFIDMHDDVSGIDHRGWYADADCNAKLRALIFNLPHGRFGCGYENSDTGERVYFNSVHDDAQNAANFADCEAESAAEAAKEYDERWQEATRLDQEERDCVAALRCYLACRNDSRTAGRELARMEISNLRDWREKLAEYSDVER